MFPTRCPVCEHDALQYDSDKVTCTHCKAYSKPLPLMKRPIMWARGKSWWWRLIILVWMLYIFALYLKDYDYPMNRMSNIFNAIDFGMHELGHFIFIFLGSFMTILGGSLTQILFPVIWLGALLWKRWYFAASLCLIWVSYNLYDVATYVADARVQLLPLVTLGDDYESAHDWYQILSRTGHLESDLAIARTMRITGLILAIIGTLFATVLLLVMAFYHKPEPPPDEDKPKPIEKGAPPSSLYPTPTRD